MFYENLQELCKENGTSVTVLMKTLGLSTGLPTFWKKGSVPKSDTLQKIADFFNVTTDYLLYDAVKGKGRPQETAEKVFDLDHPEEFADAKSGDQIVVRMVGNSMQPLIRHGDQIVVLVCDSFDDGDVVIALVGDSAVCRRIQYRDDGIALKPDNPEYDPQRYTKKEMEDNMIRLFGKGIERRGKL